MTCSNRKFEMRLTLRWVKLRIRSHRCAQHVISQFPSICLSSLRQNSSGGWYLLSRNLPVIVPIVACCLQASIQGVIKMCFLDAKIQKSSGYRSHVFGISSFRAHWHQNTTSKSKKYSVCRMCSFRTCINKSAFFFHTFQLFRNHALIYGMFI